MDNKALKIIGTTGILLGVAYVIGKKVWEDKHTPIEVYKYTAETGEIQRLK